MSNLNNRVKKLEAPATPAGSWRDFIEGKTKIDPAAWQAFVNRGIEQLAGTVSKRLGHEVTTEQTAQALEAVVNEKLKPQD